MYNRYLYYKLLSNSARKKRPGARIIQASNKIVGCIIISKGTVAALFQADSFAPDCVSPISPGECKRASVVTGYPLQFAFHVVSKYLVQFHSNNFQFNLPLKRR